MSQTNYLSEVCIHTLFEAQVLRGPDAIAVTSGEQQLSYDALNQRANQLAHELRRCGVGPEVLVAVCMQRSPELLVALLAVLKAGGAYVPLDPAYPADRLAFMLDDTQAPIMLTMQSLLGQLPPTEAQVVCLDRDWPLIARQSTENLPNALTPQSILYVIYTSGSTGRPKGVLIEHGAVMNLIGWHQCTFDLSSADRTTHLASPSFDAAVWELWPYLTIGASIHIPDEETRVTPLRLRDWLLANAITIGFLPTPLAESIVRLAWPAATALRAVLTGGDKLHRFPPPDLPFALINGYGPTENTVITTAGVIAPNASTAAPDIGQPIANTEVYILDARLNPVRRGDVGELYVGGAGLARGYLNRPDLTAERFVPNPFATTKDERLMMNDEDSDRSFVVRRSSFVRLYKTGDMARYRPDGMIEYLGRIDGQVKVRGFRIELGEIEAALRRHPDVQAALVLAHADASGIKRLVAYVVPTSDERTGTIYRARTTDIADSSLVLRPSSLASELRTFLSKRLPDYMLPAAFVSLESFPLTANGKIDRNALPVPNTRPDMATAFVAPRTTAEEVIATSWAQALDLDQVGIDDNFFELGGDSLRAIRLIGQLGERFGHELSIGMLFAHPTVARMALELAQRLGADRVQLLARAAPAPSARKMVADRAAAPQALLLAQSARSAPQRFPLSFGQQQLWLHSQQAAALPIYNEPFTVRLGGPIQVAALARSFAALVQRHEMLRATVVLDAGELVQIIRPALKVPLRVVDLQALLPDEREAAAVRLATVESNQPFDLAHGPLLRATLVQLAPIDVRLFITAHHIIIDGISLAVMLQELAALYHAFANNQLVRLAAPAHYADFVEWQRASLTEEVQAAQLDYWRRTLANLPALSLPTNHPQPAVAGFRGARQRFAITQPLTAALKTLGRRAEVSLFATLLAAFQTLLATYSGQEDIVVGTVSAGRDRPEFASLIGYLVNTLVLRTDLSGNPTFQELFRRAHAVTVGAMLHQDVPFAQVVQALQTERGTGSHPLFRVAFVLEPTAPAVAAGWNLNQLDVDSGIAKWDLVMHLEERSEGLIGRVQYSTDLFDAPTITRLIEHFQIILAGIVAAPEQRIADLPIMSAAERQLLLGEWNATATDYPDEQCIHTLIEAQAARSPDAVAVAFGNRQITYRELNQRANQLAHELRRRGVGPEVRVGLSLDRSLELIIGALGILKAGGAYVPLDPTYPQERLAFMRADSQVAVLITSTDAGRRTQDVATQPELLHDLGLTIDNVLASPAALVHRQSKIVHPDNLAYVIYTSGSTGRPKGVLLQHRGLCNTIAAMIDDFAISAESRVLQFASSNFDASVSDIFSALVSGARLVLISAEQQLPGGGLLQLLHDQAITTATLPPSLLAILPAEQLPALRTVISAGESCSAEIAARWSVGRSFINAYGPTEATICATMALIEQLKDASSVTIGRPIANAQVYLLDRHMRSVPIGVTGEVFIGGAGLARGYLNQPALTAERFVPNPFVDERRKTKDEESDSSLVLGPSSRLYATGDLARYRPDGTIEFLGRIDGQVKLRGFRIEVGEIEAALECHPAVRAAVVLAREDRPGDRRLVAYIVPTNGEERAPSFVPRPSSLASELRTFLSKRLPDYMLPTAFVCLAAFPLMPNGKVDRRALPAPTATGARVAAVAAPHTPMERMIAAIWQELLGVDSVGLYDNFYDLGGHSLLISQMYTKLRAACDHDLAIVDLFTYTTIHQLAGYLSQQPERLVAAPTHAAGYQLTQGAQRLQQLRQRKRA
jgi:amino acid adenylation domain-containing protein